MLELVLVGIVLLGLWNGWRINALANFVQSAQTVDPKSLQRSVKDTIKNQIAQSVKTPVDVSAFIEHTRFQLESQKTITTKSWMEEEIVRFLAREMFDPKCVQETPLFVPRKGTSDWAKHIQFTVIGD